MTLSFRDWIAGRTAVNVADADELYVLDDSVGDSKRITWSGLKAAAFSSPTFTGTVTTSGLTSTASVTVTGRVLAQGTVGRLRLVETDQAADSQMVEVLATGGDASFRASTDAGGLQYEFLRGIRSTGEARLTGATAVTVPAATAATHAAQVSAINATTGRLAIGSVEMGDTGWRDITSVMLGTWTADVFAVRRIGNTVEFAFDNVTGGANTSLLSGFNVGFRPSLVTVTGTLATTATVPSAGATQTMRFNTSGNMFAANGAANYGHVSFMTDAAWPTTLPGTAV